MNRNSKVIEIEYPNTADQHTIGCYRVSNDLELKKKRPYLCDSIELIWKELGENQGENWYQIIKEGQVFCEIKQSVCNVYYELLGGEQ